MFGIFKSSQVTNDDKVLDSLRKVSWFGAGTESDFERKNMLKVINSAEVYAKTSENPQIFYYIGIAWRNFTSWHIRGDERKEFLEQAINNFEHAFDLSKNTLPIQLPLELRHNADYIDQIDIAGDLGHILVEEAIIRDLDKAEPILKFVYDSTEEYEPCLCSFAELYYKRKDYKKCLEIGLNIHKRTLLSPEWKDSPPPAPLGIVGSAYRALAKKAKNDGDTIEAVGYFEKMIELKVASDNDRKILNKLKNSL